MQTATQISGATFPIIDLEDFKRKAFAWASGFEVACYLDHNGYGGYSYQSYECLVAVGTESQLIWEKERRAFDALKDFYEAKQDWLFGFLTYDLKNDVEKLTSDNFDGIGFPAMHFFQPAYVLEISENEVTIHSKEEEPFVLFQKIKNTRLSNSLSSFSNPKSLTPRLLKKDYLEIVKAIRQHIKRGDIYEMNFCQEFYAEDFRLDAPTVFQRLNKISKAPFSAFYKLNDRYLLCASPERFLKKTGDKLISQPIKGTIRRGYSNEEDASLREKLRNSPKDRSENVMIVDLVRNDLSRSCQAGTVKVEELFGMYAFEQVFQLISTVSASLEKEVHFINAVKNAFPMGSMTGAPKVRSMELIEQYERTKRGLYSGTVGYITPWGDFDFNVVIRSILYNGYERYLSVSAGGAIVFDSVPEEEYEECLLKAGAMFQVV